jgi:hypothetical protein
MFLGQFLSASSYWLWWFLECCSCGGRSQQNHRTSPKQWDLVPDFLPLFSQLWVAWTNGCLFSNLLRHYGHLNYGAF